MNIYSEGNDSKRYVSNLSNHTKPCFNNIPFRLERQICMTVENKNVRCLKLKELRTILKTQKYPNMVAEKGIKKALAFPRSNKDNILYHLYLHIILIIQTCFRKYGKYMETSKPRKL